MDERMDTHQIATCDGWQDEGRVENTNGPDEPGKTFRSVEIRIINGVPTKVPGTEREWTT